MQARHFQHFVLVWALVSMLNEGLNGYAADLHSLAPRTASLGVLFMMAAVMHCLRSPDGTRPCCRGAAGRVCAGLYFALFVSTGLPSVAWRCFSPEDAAALQGLRHGAAITFELGLLTLILIRALIYFKAQGLLTNEAPR